MIQSTNKLQCTLWFHFDARTLVMRLMSQSTIDPTIQQTAQKTKIPAKMVANGGLDASLLFSGPPEGLVLDFDIGSSLCLWYTFKTLLNLKIETENKELTTISDNITSKYNEKDIINHHCYTKETSVIIWLTQQLDLKSLYFVILGARCIQESRATLIVYKFGWHIPKKGVFYFQTSDPIIKNGAYCSSHSSLG